MATRLLHSAVVVVFGMCAATMFAQMPIDVGTSVTIETMSSVSVGDGQTITKKEMRLSGQTIAFLQIEPKGSSPLAPAPVVDADSRLEWVVVTAHWTADKHIDATCELRDNGRVIAIMDGHTGGGIVHWGVTDLDPRYSVAINTFRGLVELYAVAIVAQAEAENSPTIVRVRFPDVVLDGDDGPLGLPGIR